MSIYGSSRGNRSKSSSSIRPDEHRESSLEASAFVQETVTLPGHLSAMIGFNVNYTDGKALGGKTGVRWLHASPRLGLVIPFTRSGKTAVKAFAGRYYFGLPLSHLTYGNPDAPGGLAYLWQDKNRDRLVRRRRDRCPCPPRGTFLCRDRPFAQETPYRRTLGRDRPSVRPGLLHQPDRIPP